jgi:(S)-sulfolactate dehydrogenase
MKILITEFMDAPAVAQLAAKHEVVHDATLVDHPARMIALASSVDAIIVRNRTQVRGDLLAALTRCRVVGRLGVGLDNIDLAGCEARGIRVIPATGANAQSVAEYVVATAMLLLRGAYGASAEVAAGKWPRAALTNGREIGGKTLGLVGYGSIGQLTGRLARLLGVRVIAHDAAMPAGADLPSLALDALLAQADVVSLHVPLLDSTHHLIDARRLTAMKPGAVLINTARGGVVDEAALAEALRSGHLAGAALDVFEAEPLPAGSPLADCPNLLLTPHIAGVTAEANERVSALIAAKVLEALA